MAARWMLLALLAVSVGATRFTIAASKAQIDQAVDRGVKHLLNTQGADGVWDYPGHPEGATALAGLALLSSGVKPEDAAIQRTAQTLRARAPNCLNTYDVALLIFFFDRLGDRRDKSIIVALGERLRAGQGAGGGWSYTCPERPMPATAAMGNAFGGGDNSNTQFGLLGLWVARRHGVEVTEALARCDKRFRDSQDQDGGWMYLSEAMNTARLPLPGGLQGAGLNLSSGAMTCAGLLGLIVQFGQQASLRANDPRQAPAKSPTKAGAAGANPLKDPAVAAGMKCLERFLAPNSPPSPNNLYFLWSVERVGVAYGIDKIGAVDWYTYGADRILKLQQPDGSWSEYSPSVGTSLALLFLRRANVASDLTQIVGGMATLRSGEASDLNQSVPPRKGDKAAAGLPTSLAAVPAERLKASLPTASSSQQSAILEELRDRKGSEATLALAEAIDELDATLAAQARKFLVQRLERMTPATLARYLEYDQPEIRQAAAQAAQSKDDLTLVGPLVTLLEDRNAAAADAAHAALVKLTGQQFGAFAGQPPVARFLVIKKWKAWRDAHK